MFSKCSWLLTTYENNNLCTLYFFLGGGGELEGHRASIMGDLKLVNKVKQTNKQTIFKIKLNRVILAQH